MVTKNLWNAEKAVLRWKIIAIQSHLKKQGKFQISNLILHLKQLEKQEQKKTIFSSNKNTKNLKKKKKNKNNNNKKLIQQKERIYEIESRNKLKIDEGTGSKDK